MREALYCLREESVLRGSVFVCVGPTVDGSRPCLAALHTKTEQAHLCVYAYSPNKRSEEAFLLAF